MASQAAETAYGRQWTAKIKATEAGMQKTQTGKPMMVVEVEVLDGEHKGSTVQFRGLLNPDDPKQTARTMDAMESFGCANFRSDPFSANATAGLGRKVARGVLAMDTDQNGVERLVCKFVNEDTIIRKDAVASDSDKAAWRGQFQSVFQKIKEDKAAGKEAAGGATGGADEDKVDF
jgi:hypothetical protein